MFYKQKNKTTLAPVIKRQDASLAENVVIVQPRIKSSKQHDIYDGTNTCLSEQLKICPEAIVCTENDKQIFIVNKNHKPVRINREYYMVARKYEIYFECEQDFSRVSAANEYDVLFNTSNRPTT